MIILNFLLLGSFQPLINSFPLHHSTVQDNWTFHVNSNMLLPFNLIGLLVSTFAPLNNMIIIGCNQNHDPNDYYFQSFAESFHLTLDWSGRLMGFDWILVF